MNRRNQQILDRIDEERVIRRSENVVWQYFGGYTDIGITLKQIHAKKNTARAPVKRQ